MRGRWVSGIMALCLVVCAGFVSVAAAARSSSAAVTSAKRCAGTHSISAKLDGADYRLIKSFVICLGKQWPVSTSEDTDPGAGEGGYTSLGGIPAIVSTINSFANDPKSDATNAFIVSQLNKTNQDGSCFGYVWADTSPPPISLLSIATWIDTAHAAVERDWEKFQGGFVKTTAVVEHGAWFHDGSANNVRFAVVFAEYDPLSVTHC